MQDVQASHEERRHAIGGNNPPADPLADKRTVIISLVEEQVAAASAWVNEIREITSQDQADRAAAFKKQCHDIGGRAEAARKEEKQPHLDAGAAVDAFWKPYVKACEDAKSAVQGKLTTWLIEQDRKQREAEAAARKAAEEAERAAQLEADRATELMMRAERGELAGTGINTVAAIGHAERAQEEADRAREAAFKASQQTAKAGGQYTVGGIKRSVGLQTKKKLALDVPTGAPPKVIGAALKKVIDGIVKEGGRSDLQDLSAEIGRIANIIYRREKVVLAGTVEIEERKAV